jgi:hypothetical protein
VEDKDIHLDEEYARMEIGPALTWNEVSDLYQGTARIKHPDEVLDYFAKQAD